MPSADNIEEAVGYIGELVASAQEGQIEFTHRGLPWRVSWSLYLDRTEPYIGYEWDPYWSPGTDRRPRYEPNQFAYQSRVHTIIRTAVDEAWQEALSNGMAESRSRAHHEERDKFITSVLKRGHAGYVRFGQIPKSERSWNSRDGRYEPGVSVYPAVISGNRAVINISSVDAASALFVSAAGKLHEVIGDELDVVGSDGEPLLVNVRKRKRIDQSVMAQLSQGESS
jgi:hypothetical protein